MASTQKYLNHLLQQVGITPACSEEERSAAERLAAIFKHHGFDPQIQEFTSSSTATYAKAVLGVAVFLGTLLMGFGGPVGIFGFLLNLAAAVIYCLERMGRPVLTHLGNGGLSQNVIAYHQASGPMASPRNRPVVIVAHYDSPRVDFLAQMPFAQYRSLLMRALLPAMIIPAAVSVLNLLPLPGAAKTLLWLLSLLVALVPLSYAVAIIANRFILPYTSGAVCNKSSVAAMLGVMEATSPYQGEVEFPDDMPFDEFMAEQQELAANLAAQAAVALDDEQEEQEIDQVERDLSDTGLISDAASHIDDEGAQAASDDQYDQDRSMSDGDAASTRAFSTVHAEIKSSDATVEMATTEDEDGGSSNEGGLDAKVEDHPVSSLPVNAYGNLRFGEDIIRSLGMVSDACRIVYESTEDDPDEAGDLSAIAAANDRSADVHAIDQDADVTNDEYLEGDASRGEDGLSVPSSVAELVAEGEELHEEVKDNQASVAADEHCEAQHEASAQHAHEDEAGDATSDQTAGVEQDEASQPVAQVKNSPAARDMKTARDDQDATTADPGKTQLYHPTETVDSLMAEINAAETGTRGVDSTRSIPRQIPPVVPDASALQTCHSATRNVLFDVPDPSHTTVDPFSALHTPSRAGFSVVDAGQRTPHVEAKAPEQKPEAQQPVAVIPPVAVDTEDEVQPYEPAEPRGLARLFGGRKKKKRESMSEWLGVDKDFNAKKTGGEIGSWDNFDSDDDSSWKGGAAAPEGSESADLVEAITSLGDDELLGHDIWFVATGSSEWGNAGINAFLAEHRDKLRGVFLINLESVGAGQLSIITTEGEKRQLKGDRRIMKLVSRVSADFHHDFATAHLPFDTDAYAAMQMSLRSLTIAGMDGTRLACARTDEDQTFNVDAENVQVVADVVTEVIRRS
ncbi:M28 family peptidase [Collinsella sp. AGMB00827]|uniref:M28 family peptidase n=1 Tax=Collinsella ureilytica TaxID=2869515 RepID=A0ABS7MKB7_9ACTN|nr:M28 family peptidase [Collinsella urealyticum]MBY4797816.1 M28 family peptidase [Collinsella urealyticum]